MTKEFRYRMIFLLILIPKICDTKYILHGRYKKMLITQVMTYLTYNYYQFIINKN